jgi:hypothetical protein
MLDLGTIAGLYEHDHQLAAYRQRCDVDVTPILRSHLELE